MHWLDWTILLLPIVVCMGIAIKSKRYVRGVSDFMAGGRHAGRYLICTARSEQGHGAAVYVAVFQGFLVSGFTLSWWNQLSVPVALLLTVSGYVIYRYRQTRVLTLGEFFEKRYSRKFRLFAGVLGFFAGLLNFGVIPAVGARFMVAFLQLPQSFSLGGIEVPTYLALMAAFLGVCVLMTTTAGQISVLLTDCAEGMFSQIFFLLIAVVLLVNVFDWPATQAALLDRPKGQSLVNPFDSFGLENFNIWYVLIGIFFLLYRTIAWQNQHAFNSSAATPHEARMGNVLGRWRGFASSVMITLLSLCAMTYFYTHPGQMDAALSGITDPATRDQMKAPVALTMMLPVGAKGALLAICLMGIIAGDGIHLHSWSSIFIQDVVMPLRKKPLSPKQHVRLLRLGVVGVALWAFFFGWIFPQTKFVNFWWAITEAIFVSGAGIALIGGLYWARGTAAGAWAAILVGATLAFSGLGIQFYYERVLGRDFLLTLPEISFFSAIAAVLVYFVVSWLTCRAPHDMDKLLHRGEYTIAEDVVAPAVAQKKQPLWLKILGFGIDENFSRSDRWITIGITGWSMFWFSVFAIGSLVYLGLSYTGHAVSNRVWSNYWLWVSVYLPLAIGAITTVWFTWGGLRDMVVFFKRLKADADAAEVTARPALRPEAINEDEPVEDLLTAGTPGNAAALNTPAFQPGKPAV